MINPTNGNPSHSLSTKSNKHLQNNRRRRIIRASLTAVLLTLVVADSNLVCGQAPTPSGLEARRSKLDNLKERTVSRIAPDASALPNSVRNESSLIARIAIGTVRLGRRLVGVFFHDDGSSRIDLESDKVETLTDQEVMKLFLSKKPPAAEAAVDEIMRRGQRMIPLLAKNKNKQTDFCGIDKLGHWGPGTLVVFLDHDSCKTTSRVTSEVASLFLISAIYYEDRQFAGPPMLCDRVSAAGGETSGVCSNDSRRIRAAWASIDDWLKVYRREGIQGLRSSGQAPLRGSTVDFF
jgi:hypothetical protein